MTYVDNALPDVDAARACALEAPFGDVVGPDGLTYPDTSPAVPDPVGIALYTLIRRLAGPVVPHLLFFRLNTSETKIPHWVHSDGKLGTFTAVLSLTLDRDTPPGAGTATVRHKSGMTGHPETDDEYAAWARDTNDASRWDVTGFVPMCYNRLVLLTSDTLHAACPAGGFGSGPGDGRLVLTTFFSRVT